MNSEPAEPAEDGAADPVPLAAGDAHVMVVEVGEDDAEGEGGAEDVYVDSEDDMVSLIVFLLYLTYLPIDDVKLVSPTNSQQEGGEEEYCRFCFLKPFLRSTTLTSFFNDILFCFQLEY